MQLRLQLILLFYFSRSFFCDDYEIKEENIVGLEDFLMSLDPQTSDVLLELLQAKTLPEKKGNRRMKNIMRKLPPATLDRLLEIYKETMPRK